MKKIILYIILTVIIPYSIYSQDASFHIPNQTGNVPVNPVTGAPNINIPLWNVTSGNLSLPISLSYSTNGIRANETPSEVGLSWQLNAGGSITLMTRGRRGLPDTSNVNNPSSDYINSVLSGFEDSEPDFYFVNAPGLSLIFSYSGTSRGYYMDNFEGGEFFPLTELNIKIELIITAPPFDTNGHKFKITKDNGTQYFFMRSITEGHVIDLPDPYSDKQSFTTKWLLSKMVNANNTDSIIIKYNEPEVNGNWYLNDYLCKGEFLLSDNSINGKTYQYIHVAEIPVEEIISNNEKVTFDISDADVLLNGTYSTPYHDCYYSPLPSSMNEEDNILNKIEIKNKDDQTVKSYGLDYIKNGNNRLFLKQITEINPTNDSLPPYVFDYNEINLLYPVSHINYDPWMYATNSNDEVFPEYGMLTTVYYPGGGHSVYEYERNTYYFPYNNSGNEWYDEDWNIVIEDEPDKTNITGPGVRVKSVEIFEDDVKVNTTLFEYKDDEGNSSGRLSVYPVNKYYLEKYGYPYTVTMQNSAALDMGYITYGKITSYSGGKIENTDRGVNGKTEYYYSLEAPAENDTQDDDETFPYKLKVFNREFNGLPDSTIVYDNSDQKKTLQESNYSTTENQDVFLRGLIVVKPTDHHTAVKSWYKIYQKSIKPLYGISKTYASNNDNNFISEYLMYFYERNENTYLYPTNIRKVHNDVINTYLYYSEDFAGDGGVYDKMIERNILSPVVKKEVIKNGVQVSGEQTVFNMNFTTEGDTLIVAEKLNIWEDGSYKTVNWFHYNDKGNLFMTHSIDNVYHSVIYGHNNTLPVVNIINALPAHVHFNGFEEGGENIIQGDSKTGNNSYNGTYHFDYPLGYYDDCILSYWKKDSNEWIYHEEIISYNSNGYTLNGQIDEVRVFPTDAYISTTAYKPLIGKISETDANNVTIYYEYDDFGRLIKIYDQDRNLINKTKYHIKEPNTGANNNQQQ